MHCLPSTVSKYKSITYAGLQFLRSAEKNTYHIHPVLFQHAENIAWLF